MSKVPCSVDGCDRKAKKGGRCYGHLKLRHRQLAKIRKKDGHVDPDEVPMPERQLRSYGEHPRSLLVQAALRYADAESDKAFKRAYDMLRKAARKYVGALLR